MLAIVAQLNFELQEGCVANDMLDDGLWPL